MHDETARSDGGGVAPDLLAIDVRHALLGPEPAHQRLAGVFDPNLVWLEPTENS